MIRNDKGHSICIPILTYGGRGLLKPGLHPENHAVIYSGSFSKDRMLLKGEEYLTPHRPVKVAMDKPSERLHPTSRLNYAKTYTVEHNVKVCSVGYVARKCERDVANAFNEANPPVAPSNASTDRLDSPMYNTTKAAALAVDFSTASPYQDPSSGASQYTQYSAMDRPATSHPYSHPLDYSANPQIPFSGDLQPDQGYSHSQPRYDDGYDDF